MRRFALLLVLLVLAGCTSSAATEPDGGVTSSVPTDGLAQRLAAAGIDCGGQKLDGNVQCTHSNGESVTVSFESWHATEGARRSACKAGVINPGYLVATDRKDLTIAADQNDTTKQLAQALGLHVEHYCPS